MSIATAGMMVEDMTHQSRRLGTFVGEWIYYGLGEHKLRSHGLPLLILESITEWIQSFEMWSIRQLCSLFAIYHLGLAVPLSRPVVLRDYGSFTGTEINATYSGAPLPSPVDAWLGIEYATQPVGENRYRPIDWPASFKGVKAATDYSKMCVQGPDVEEQGEDCLTFNVYRTKGIPLSEKLPVLVWIHGGAFISGGWHDFDGASFVASSSAPIMVVTFHYRLNAFGFLPSTLFEEEGIQNLGLQDQYFFLKSFVQKHIESFGGDRTAVTLGGRSAGAHSVGINYFHNYGKDANEPYFARAIHQSGSVTARAFPNATYPLYVSQFETFMEHLNCTTESNTEAMACLRSASIEDIQTVGMKLYLESTDEITWPFQPAQGGPMLEKPGSESGYDGTCKLNADSFTRVPVHGKAHGNVTNVFNRLQGANHHHHSYRRGQSLCPRWH
jgi:acetylcholinesterase